MKKFIGILSVLCMIASMSSCGNSSSKDSEKSSGKSSDKSSSAEANTEKSEKTTKAEKTTEDKAVTTEKATEKTTEPPTEKPTISEEEKAKRIASDTEYLENIQPYLLDFTVCDVGDAHLEKSVGKYHMSESDIAGYDKATILTVGYDYNTTTTQWIKKVEIVDNNGDAVLQTNYGTSWKIEDENDKLWGVVRYRVPGEYAPEDLKIKMTYDDDYGVMVEKDFSATLGFEEFGQNLYWQEQAKNYADIKHPCIYKINGRYCFVDETSSTTSGGSLSGGKHTDYVGRGFHITPLDGDLNPVLTKDEITVESANTQPYMYCELDKFKNDSISTSIVINICCVTDDADWYVNWDSLSDEEKNGARDVDAMIHRYQRAEARDSYLCVPDGEGGITKIDCTNMGLNWG